MLQKAPIAINDSRMRALLGNAQVFSITYRLFKLPGLLEPQSEDYGQIATYKVLASLLICMLVSFALSRDAIVLLHGICDRVHKCALGLEKTELRTCCRVKHVGY